MNKMEEDKIMQFINNMKPEEKEVINTQNSNDNQVVLAEIPVSSTQLHKIANGSCCTLHDTSSQYSLRFLLKSSFKSRKSNFVINNFVMQVIVRQNKKYMTKEDIATKVKVVKTEGKRQKKEEKHKQDVKTEIVNNNRTLF